MWNILPRDEYNLISVPLMLNITAWHKYWFCWHMQFNSKCFILEYFNQSFAHNNFWPCNVFAVLFDFATVNCYVFITLTSNSVRHDKLQHFKICVCFRLSVPIFTHVTNSLTDILDLLLLSNYRAISTCFVFSVCRWD